MLIDPFGRCEVDLEGLDVGTASAQGRRRLFDLGLIGRDQKIVAFLYAAPCQFQSDAGRGTRTAR